VGFDHLFVDFPEYLSLDRGTTVEEDILYWVSHFWHPIFSPWKNRNFH